MKKDWRNCQAAKNGQYHINKDGKMGTVSVDLWCDHGLYSWNWVSSRQGTTNERTMLSFYPIFIGKIIMGTFKIHLHTFSAFKWRVQPHSCLHLSEWNLSVLAYIRPTHWWCRKIGEERIHQVTRVLPQGNRELVWNGASVMASIVRRVQTVVRVDSEARRLDRGFVRA